MHYSYSYSYSPKKNSISDTNVITKAIKDLYTEFIVKTNDFNNLFDTFKIKYKPSTNTASWRFDEPDIHHITLGKVSSSFSIKKQKQVLSNYLFHEMAHSEFTNRNIKSTLAKLVKAKVPFDIYNLFEDARIEHLWSKKYDYEFTWRNHERFLAKGAYETFFKIIQTTNRKEYFRNNELEYYNLVIPFYRAAIRVKDEDQMITIVKKFMETFQDEIPGDFLKNRSYSSLEFKEYFENYKNKDKQDSSSKEKGSKEQGKTKGENSEDYTIEVISEVAGLEKFRNKIDNQDEMTNENDKEEKDTKGLIEKLLSSKKQGKEKNYLNEGLAHSVDETVVNEIINLFSKVFKNSVLTTPTYNAKRINPTRMVLDHDKVFSKKYEITKKSNLDLAFIIDMSGSMDIIFNETVNIVYALNEIAKMGVNGIKLIFSGTSGYQSINLPVESEIIRCIEFADDWGEGIEKTLKAYEKKLKNTKNIIILTDGWITDDEIDKKYFIEKGIKITGIYFKKSKEDLKEYFSLSEEEYIEYEESGNWRVDEVQDETLLEWFHEAIVKTNETDVIEEIIRRGITL